MDFRINLQLFSEEKTEQATPKKIKDAREKGNVLQSKEVNSALILLAIFIIINAFATFIGVSLLNMTRAVYTEFLSANIAFSVKNLQILSIKLMIYFFIAVGPIALTSLVVGLISSYAQVGVLLTS